MAKQKKQSYDDLVRDFTFNLNPDGYSGDEEELDEENEALQRFFRKVMIAPKSKEIEKIEDNDE